MEVNVYFAYIVYILLVKEPTLTTSDWGALLICGDGNRTGGAIRIIFILMMFCTVLSDTMAIERQFH